MATWFVSRHSGALAWAEKRKLRVDRFVAHLELDAVRAGDSVIGTLPVNLIAKLQQKGACYIHLSLDMPLEWRGRELSSRELEQIGAELHAYTVQEIPLPEGLQK